MAILSPCVGNTRDISFLVAIPNKSIFCVLFLEQWAGIRGISWAKSRHVWTASREMGARAEHRNWDTQTHLKSVRTRYLRSSTALYLQRSTMDSSTGDRELVAKIRHDDAPEAGSRRMPGFSAINAAGDADGRRKTVSPANKGLFRRNKPSSLFGTTRTTKIKKNSRKCPPAKYID